MDYKRTLYYEGNGSRIVMANRLKRDYEFGYVPAIELMQEYTDESPSLDIYTIIIEEIIKEYGKENEVN
jgi:hypothetical protein